MTEMDGDLGGVHVNTYCKYNHMRKNFGEECPKDSRLGRGHPWSGPRTLA